MHAALVIAVVSGALILGALWGTYGRLGPRLEGFIVALAGGALVVSAVLELASPALQSTELWAVAASILVGAVVFVGVDLLVDRKLGAESGGGLLAAITLDGIPENLALGVALISTGPLQVAALSGSILLSNLPEAAGGAREMRRDHPPAKVLALWTATAVALALAALAGHLLLADAAESALGLVKCFACGAVVASLATEVFPKAYRDDQQLAGLATAIGLVLALALDQLG